MSRAEHRGALGHAAVPIEELERLEQDERRGPCYAAVFAPDFDGARIPSRLRAWFCGQHLRRAFNALDGRHCVECGAPVSPAIVREIDNLR